MKNAWVLLANGDIGKRLYFLHPHSQCPALIPVHTKTLLQTALGSPFRQDFQTFLVVNRAHTKELAFFESQFPDVVFLYVDNQRGVIDTLKEAWPRIGQYNEICINPITTVLEQIPPLPGAVFGETKVYSNQYAGIDESGNLVSKGTLRSLEEGIFPFAGVIRASAKEIEKALRGTTNSFDLMELVKQIRSASGLALTRGRWLDFGHDFAFFDSRARLLSSRSFNKVEVSPAGELRKTSRNVEKLGHEYSFLASIPADLQVFFPRLFTGFTREENAGSFGCEFYAYPCVSELVLHWDIQIEVWQKLFANLQTVLHHFARHRAPGDRRLRHELLVQKTLDRHEEYLTWLEKNDPVFFQAVQKDLRINGVTYPPFKKILPRWKSYLESRLGEGEFTVMHGDFCFNNILFEPSVGLVKLIDPRGSLDNTQATIYGDQRYDLAKLLHSCEGSYDFFVNDLFLYTEVGGEFTFNLHPSANFYRLTHFGENLVQAFGYDIREIRVHMANLFLSMPMLHGDNPCRQKALYLHGLKLLCELLDHAEKTDCP